MRVGSLENTRTRTRKSLRGGKASGVFAQRFATPASLDTRHLHGGIIEKCGEKSNRIRAAANAGDEQIGQASFDTQNLFARFFSNHFVKIAHDLRVGMRAETGTQQKGRRA